VHYLLATDSVHTTAAGCDYLLDVAGLDTDDRVTVLTVADPEAGADERDTGDAANVATARLTGFCELEFAERAVAEGPRDGDEAAADPASEILDAADALDADVLLVGPHGGSAGDGPELGSTARAVLEGATVPVVVLPLEALS
jgi:nucleotide-binding universal stress UspA family protein